MSDTRLAQLRCRIRATALHVHAWRITRREPWLLCSECRRAQPARFIIATVAAGAVPECVAYALCIEHTRKWIRPWGGSMPRRVAPSLTPHYGETLRHAAP